MHKLQGRSWHISNALPQKKQIINNKRQEDKDNQKIKYNEIAKHDITTNTKTPIQSNINSDTHAKILTCMLHAHFMNMADPGTWNRELNNMLKLNSLPEIKAPNNPPSLKILTKAQEAEEIEVEEEKEKEEEQYRMEVTTEECRKAKKETTKDGKEY